ncbi:MAG: hypothetical protein EON58_05290 [Alphaproteobacteria bacterium]|nr:MAG: hypothetical protein EON58_05290 [Alphaproteobacteria bacterium]
MPAYLVKREGTYYFRRVVPKELQAAIGKTQFMWSLKTKNLAEAKRLRNRDASKTDLLLAAAEKPVGEAVPISSASRFTVHNIQENAVRIAASFRRYLQEGAEQGDLKERRASLESTLQLHVDNAEHGWLIEDTSLAQSEAYILALRSVLEGQPLAAPSSELTNPVPAGSRKSVTLKALLERWKEAQAPTDRSVLMWKRTVRDFLEGQDDVQISQIKRSQIIDFKDRLAKRGNSAATIGSRLNHLRALFRFAVSQDFIEADPASGVKAPSKKTAEKERYPWTVTAMNRLFSGPVHCGGEVPEAARGSAGYFLPLLALYTGARLNELGQLRPQDVVVERYKDGGEDKACWTIRFVHAPADGVRLKNLSSVRRIPVHPELERLGFIALVEEAKARGNSRIFDDLAPDSLENLTSAWGKWFGRYIRITCGISDTKITFHSFRHTFKDTCRALGLPEDVHDAVTGHSDGRVARKYGGNTYPLGPMVKLMEDYKVYDLRLISPYLQS